MRKLINLLLLLVCNAALAQQPNVKLIKSEFIFHNAPFKACHASTLALLNKGNLMAAWFGGSNEGNADVCIWSAIKKGNQWSKPIKIADGLFEGKQYPCWNPVLFKTKAGLLMLHYKIGSNPREWWAMLKTSSNDGKSWSAAKKLTKGYLGPIKNKPLQLANGDILYPSSTESLDEKIWQIHIEKSDAKGENFKKISIDCGNFGVIQPSILQYQNGSLQLLCRSRQNVVVSTWSYDNGQTWTKLNALNLPNPNSGTDAVSLKNGLQVLIYNPLYAGKNWWEGRSILKVAISKNGKDWKDVYTLEEHTTGEYSYPAIIADEANNVYISYTAERKNIKHVQLKF